MARGRGRQFAAVHVSIWEDEDFTKLGADEQLVYLMAVSSPDLSYAGVLPLLPQRFARLAKGMTLRRVQAALKSLADDRYLIIDEETAEACVRTYLRYDGILKQPNLIRAMNKAYEKVHSDAIRAAIADEVARALGEGFPDGFSEGIAKALGEGFAGPIAEGTA